MSYSLDIYYGKLKPIKISFHLLPVSFFPQLVAGLRGVKSSASNFKKRVFKYQQESRIKDNSLGIFQKVVIADNLGEYVDKVFIQYVHGSTLFIILFFYIPNLL